MQFQALPHYFIIKINIEKQKERREKVGSLYAHFSHIHMGRNMQEGEIVAIGTIAAKQFPEASIGDTLLLHHFVEGAENEKSNFIYSDSTFNYYNATASEYNGHRNETYGILKDGQIIPHPEFVFIEPKEKEQGISVDEFIEKNTKQVGSLLLFSDWQESRESLEEKAQRITTEIKNQSQGKSMSDSTKMGLQEKEKEAEKITASLNKKEYKSYQVAFANPILQAKEKVFALSMAAQLELEVRGKTYIVMQTKYVAATA